MLYTKENRDHRKHVIKLTLDINRKHYPNFPSEVYVSEFNLDNAITKLSGLDVSIKNNLEICNEEHNKSWICFGVTALHMKNHMYFGINGNTFTYKWL